MSRYWHGLKCLVYELMPIHPVYLHKQLIDLKSIIITNSKILAPKLLELSLFILKSLTFISLRSYIAIFLWCSILALFVYVEFGSFFIIITLFGLIFSNLSEGKSGDLSAYSVFNKGFTTLLGQSTGQQFDNEIRHRHVEDDDEFKRVDNVAQDKKDPVDMPRKRGKKARRGYEARLERRANEENQLETFDEYLD
mmetsp:Transcript_35472/g.33651  ORF Transcript_35472/g.33651 Transcript_35472/m.33651 type:complete len:195 (-) Transcript_35472:319-903(-)